MDMKEIISSSTLCVPPRSSFLYLLDEREHTKLAVRHKMHSLVTPTRIQRLGVMDQWMLCLRQELTFSLTFLIFSWSRPSLYFYYCGVTIREKEKERETLIVLARTKCPEYHSVSQAISDHPFIIFFYFFIIVPLFLIKVYIFGGTIIWNRKENKRWMDWLFLCVHRINAVRDQALCAATLITVNNFLYSFSFFNFRANNRSILLPHPSYWPLKLIRRKRLKES